MIVTAYHGSGVKIDSFDYQFTEIGNDQLGSGFYFTSSIDEAEGYCFNTAQNQNKGKPKPGGMHDKTIHKVEIELKKPINTQHEMLFTVKDVISIISKSPELDENLSNWGDLEYEKKDKLVREAAETYASNEKLPTLKILFALHNDFFDGHPEAFFKAIRDQYGFDGVIHKFDSGHSHFVAWFNDQIKMLEHINLVHKYQAEAPDVGNVDDPLILPEMLLYHGTDEESAMDILNNGIDMSKTHKGYFGLGFYTTPDAQLAKSNYADMADGDAAIVVSRLKKTARIADARTEEGFEVIKKLERLFGRDDLHETTKKMGVDGLFDRSFGGIVIYNKEAIETIGLLNQMPFKHKVQI